MIRVIEEIFMRDFAGNVADIDFVWYNFYSQRFF